MKKIVLLFILTNMTLVESCSHQTEKKRLPATPPTAPSCWDSIKGEYQNYFDSVEKCLEKESEK